VIFSFIAFTRCDVWINWKVA